MEVLDGNGEEKAAKEQLDEEHAQQENFTATNHGFDEGGSPEVASADVDGMHVEASTVSATSDPEVDTMISERSADEDIEVSAEQATGSREVNEDKAVDQLGEADKQVEENVKEEDSESAEDVEAFSEQQDSVLESEASQSIMSNKEESNKNVVEKDADDEVDDFFQQPSAPAKAFPGLDNVDLASDDESPDALEQNKHQNEKSAQSVEATTPPKQDEMCYCSEDKELSKLPNATPSPLKDYPINVGNYKVCRQVGPGVKECIILETGEQVKCFGKSNSPTLSSSSIIQAEPQSTSSPRNDLVPVKTENGQMDTQQQSANNSNASENFEYQSFPDGSASTIIAAAESNLNPDSDIVMGQQIFITENGIPVIMDNAEDDVKINIQAEMDRVSKAIQSLQKSGADLVAGNIPEDVVGDVLSSGDEAKGGRNHQNDARSMQVNKSKRKKDKERFYVLQPDKVDDTDNKSESEDIEMNRNNNSNINDNNNAGGGSPSPLTEDRQLLEGEGEEDREHCFDVDGINSNTNESSMRRLADPILGAGATRTSNLRSQHSHGSSYYDDIPSWARTRHDDVLSERYSPSVLRGSSLTDRGRFMPPRRDNSHFRYDDSASSLEASRISTRYSMLDRGQQNSSPSTNTKQVSWHDMFKMIEEQHRSQQQQQYLEHQRILQEMQESMKEELSKQQDTLKDRLNKYNEMLEELSLGRHNIGQHEVERDFSPSVSSGQEDIDVCYRDVSRTTLDGVPISLRYPPPLSSQGRRLVQDSDCYEETLYDRTPVKRSLEKELKSSPRPADTSLNSSQVSFGEDKLLRGGVYSSPMPLAKAKHKGSPKASKTYDKALSSQHSPRDRDREEMAARHTPPQNFSLNAATLTSENAELRERCQDLEDACHDKKIEIRELTQKMQGLERRANDCTERYETSQSQVVTLHNRLEELTEYAKERDCSAAEMEMKAKQTAESLQSAHKREKELTDSLQAAKVTIRKLVEKYEMLEKDHDLLKDSYKDQEQSLLMARKELREVASKTSRIELENKQLIHEKDMLKHDLTMARSSPTKTNFEEALQSMPTNQRRREGRGGPENKNLDRAYRSSSQERPRKIQDYSSTEPEYSDSQQSPIMKAEQELQKLRESMASGKDFAPKLQRKFYGADVPRSSSGGYRGYSAPTPNRHGEKIEVPLQAPKSISPRDAKKGLRSQMGGSRRSCPAGIATKSTNRFVSGKKARPTSRSTENGLSGDQAIERVKAGEIISRPAWEDMYTSMAPAGKTNGIVSTKKHGADVLNSMREMSLKERLQSIENLERKYDDLISDKRKFESALTRVRPGQSHRREKERLETELDRVDRELGSIRMSLKRFHVLKSSI